MINQKDIKKNKKVFIGISGGVDSAVAAYLLKEQGYDVHGVFMKNWSGEDLGLTENCPWKEDQEAAIAVCDHLGISFRTYNFEKEYSEKVITDFFEEYQRGNTPNPDVLCNQFIKFDAFYEKAMSEGADFIATGHYVRGKDGGLYKAKDANKDQTYFLCMVRKEKLQKSLFPLGDLTKPDVREVAEKIDLPNAKRPDSQGICFIGKVEMEKFLELKIKHKVGKIIDIDTGKALGEHTGVWFHTLGQRKGLRIGGAGTPYFVAQKDVGENILYVAQGNDHKELWKETLEVEDINLIAKINQEIPITASIRYRSEDTPIELTQGNSVNTVTFKQAQWTPTVGQFVAFFQEDRCIGGARIKTIIHH
jgi:tRNA-uridine 2-sulfurtransferase